LRLDPRFRYALYVTVATLFITGVAWLLADQLKDSPTGEVWQAIGANLLMVHGGGAMVMLIMLGALIPLHVRRSWRAGKNRIAGTVMCALNVVLVVTAFGLYYSGGDTLRIWTSDVHIVVGICLPIALVIHIAAGRLRPVS
jgi:hypothetical protein